MGTRAHANATASTPERTLEIGEYQKSVSSRRSRLVFLHQRADGRLMEGGRRKPLPYAPNCALAQRLTGQYGFAWVKVIERSPPPEHQIAWPIRREDCFSNKPIATLIG